MRTAIILLLALIPWEEKTPTDILMGEATYYNDGVMRQTILNKGLSLSDGVALNRKGDIGRTVWLQWGDGSVTGPLQVVDCAQRIGHYEKRERQGRVVDVSAALAKAQGFYKWGPILVMVWFKQPNMTWY